MRQKEFPTRLKHSPEFAELLGEAALAPLDEARLARNWAAIEAQITAVGPSPDGGAGSDGAGSDVATATSSATALAPKAATLARGLIAMTVAGIIAAGVYQVATETPPPAITTAEAVREVVVTPAPEPTPEPVAVVPRTPSAQGSAAPSVKKAEQTRLSQELALYEQAVAALAAGDATRALTKIDVLERDFADGALVPEVRLTKAEALVSAGRDQEAIGVIREVLGGERASERRARLYRLLGDAQARLGRCDEAREAYQRALGQGLPEAEAQAARAGLRSCVTR